MRRNVTQSGFTLLEVMVSTVLVLFLMLATLGAYSQIATLKGHVDSSIEIQSNLRLGMDRMTRDLRLIGFAVPQGTEIGGTALWAPAIFRASVTDLGFRSEIDGGYAEVVCTPKSSNSDCPLSKLRLDAIDYYQGLSCNRPDGVAGDLRLVVMLESDQWKGYTCSGHTVSDTSISTSTLPDDVFEAAKSEAATIEQVYYRYVASSSAPDYGRLERYVRYDNSPSNTFPPTGVTWDVVARQLTDFSLEFRDETGTLLTGSPLSQANREAVRRVVLFMEGYAQDGPNGVPQLLQIRSEIRPRNLGT